MATFADKAGLVWEIAIDAIGIDRVRAEADPNFLLNDDAAKVNTAMRLAADPAMLCHAIYALCEKQRIERSVTLETFYKEVLGNGEAIEAAGDAMENAIANFTHPRKREVITAIANKQREVTKLAAEKALAKINDPDLMEKLSKALDAQMDAELAKALTRLENVIGSQDSSASARSA